MVSADDRPLEAESGPGLADVLRDSGTERSSLNPGRLWVLSLAGGLLAGLVAWTADEPIHGYFKAPLRQVVTMGYASLRTTPADSIAASIKNAAVAYGLLGGLLGAALGLTGGLARGNRRAALAGAAVGLVSGASLTALMAVPALSGYWSYFGDNPLGEELGVPFLTHTAVWGPIGLTGGLALALGAGGGRPAILRAALGGLIGAIVGTVLYEFTGAAFFPLDQTTFPISASASSRCLARLAVALCATTGALLAFSPRRTRPARAGV